MKTNEVLGLVLIIIGLLVILNVANGPVAVASTLTIADAIVGILVLVAGIYVFKK